MNRTQPIIRIALLLLLPVFIFPFLFINVSSVQAEEKQVKIGVLAQRGTEHCLKKWSPTAEYLSQNISGYSFSIIPLSFDQLVPVTEKGEIDFVLSNSSYYVTLEINQQVNRLVTLINKDVNGKLMTTFAGVIFTRADRQDISSIKDLIGKSFVGTDSRSLGGWQAALLELKQAGITPRKDFTTLSFAETHDAAVYAVLDNQADVGCVRTSTLERMAEEGKINLADLKVIHYHPHLKSMLSAHHLLHSTRAYPEWPLAKLNHINDALAGQVAKTLIEMPSNSFAAQRSHSFGWSVPLNYQPVHVCLRELRIGPYRDYGKISVVDVFKQYWAYI
ncbi:MAG: phosphate/phosphite/phosphonate ABC transporter substrate-binding protein, partial [Pseudomonadota bacterium]|nr:phosphate/phosphite/phosphonate ABC transporter substrate-binding protein [Pseudomonadota bacterium]